MINIAKRVLTDITTNANGKDFCHGRVVGLFSVVSFTALQLLALHKGQEFHPQDFGLGLAAILAAIGALISLKAKTEPDAISDTSNK